MKYFCMRCFNLLYVKMHNLLIFAITSCVLAQGFCFPTRVEENGESDIEEADYEGASDGPEDDNSANEVGEAARPIDQDEAADTAEEETESQPALKGVNDVPSSLRATEDEIPNANHYKFSGSTIGKKIDGQDNYLDTNSIYRVQSKQSDSSTLDGKVNDDSQRVFNDYKLQSDAQVNRRTLESRTIPNEEGRLLFQNEKEDKRGYNSETGDTSDISQVMQAYRKNQPADKALNKKGHKFRRFHLNRDRRNSEGKPEDSSSSASDSKELDNFDISNEEAAIKRHVQNLSSAELDELLNSLTDDKRELLKNIMGNEFSEKNNIVKREITKKAGLLQENSNVDSGQPDVGKIQEDNAGDADPESTSMPISSSSPTPESADITITKANDAFNGSLVSSSNTDSVGQVNEPKIDVSDISLKLDSSVTNNLAKSNTDTKSNTKREVKDDKANINENNQGAASFQDEDLTQLLNDETQLHEDNKNMFKRQASENEGDFSDSIRSLEESFPETNSFDESDTYSGSDMAPLIRVKRKNDVVLQKRGAAVLPEAKVAYFPYRAENDDEDNEEGNEMGDNGFYDRSSNIALNVDDTSSEDQPAPSEDSAKFSANENIESEARLGSDTDGVLSGVEGVDDNLMFSNSARNRRESENNPETEPNNDAANSRSVRSTRYIEEEETATANFIGVSNLPVESDAFGALPRNYDGELGRYKRVRRVKQPQESVSDA